MNTINGLKIAETFWECFFCEQVAKIKKIRAINYLKKSDNPEVKEIVDYFSNNKVCVFPYEYTKNYNYNDVFIGVDENNGMFYTNRNGITLYLGYDFKNTYDAKQYYNRLLIEQDIKSPHRYLTDSFMPDDQTIVIDVGGAEGNFSVDVLNICKKIYIFECEQKWVDALNNTFSDYKDKVEIIPKFVSDKSEGDYITLDDFLNSKNIINEKLFIKIDAEGSELDILKGAKNTCINNDYRIAVCTYHAQNHEKLIRNMFKKDNIDVSNGYMFFLYDYNLDIPFLRRGVLRITRSNNESD